MGHTSHSNPSLKEYFLNLKERLKKVEILWKYKGLNGPES